MCYECGQLYCEDCRLGKTGNGIPDICPVCRADCRVSEEVKVARLERMLGRSPGRHTLYAQDNLGAKYLEGKGVAQSIERAADLFLLAAEQGHADSMANLASAHLLRVDHMGARSADDIAIARRWGTLAANQGNTAGQKVLQILRMLDGTADNMTTRSVGGITVHMCPESAKYVDFNSAENVAALFASLPALARLMTPTSELIRRMHSVVSNDSHCNCHKPLTLQEMNDTVRAVVTRSSLAAAEEQLDQRDKAGPKKPSPGKPRFCSNAKCGAKKPSVQCSQCQAAWYCNRDCQRLHWKRQGHKTECTPIPKQ